MMFALRVLWRSRFLRGIEARRGLVEPEIRRKPGDTGRWPTPRRPGRRRCDEGGDDAPPALAGVRQRVAHEVRAAALPGGVEHLGDGGLDALMGVGHDQLGGAQAAAGELAQKRRPERLGFGGTDIHAKNFAQAVARVRAALLYRATPSLGTCPRCCPTQGDRGLKKIS